MANVRVVYQPEVGQVVDTAGLAAWLATDAGRAAIRAGVRAELRDLSVVLADNAAEIFNLGDRNDPVGRALFLVACDIAKFTSKPAAPCEPAAGAWDVKGLVDRFLAWKLPRSVCADLCATRQQEGRSGTNLLSATEARQMIEHLLATPPAAPDPRLPGLRAARDAADELRLQGMRLALVEISSGPGDEVERDKHAAAKLRAEIARRGGA